MKPPLRTKTLGTKVSEEEFAQLEEAARGLAQTLPDTTINWLPQASLFEAWAFLLLTA